MGWWARSFLISIEMEEFKVDRPVLHSQSRLGGQSEEVVTRDYSIQMLSALLIPSGRRRVGK